jgi:hypothetical protein
VNTLLAARGWQELPDGELCWLDCAVQGLRKQWHHSEIVLCEPHALKMEDGRVNATYAGAPLPADSAATKWPWLRLETPLVSVV